MKCAEWIDLVGLDPAGGDQLHQAGVGDDSPADEGSDLVEEVPGIGSGLDDQGIGRLQVGCRPTRPGGKFDPAW